MLGLQPFDIDKETVIAKVQYQLRPGDEIRFEAAGDVIRVVPPATGMPTAMLDVNERLELFDAATIRQRNRQAQANRRGQVHRRSWTREDLYLGCS